MKKLTIVLSSLLLLAGGGVLLWQKLYPTYVYRYKLTIDVETPNGIKSGSSVYEVQTTTFPRWLALGGSTDSVQVFGDAVYVDLEEGKNLFGLVVDSFELLAPTIVLGENTIRGMSRAEMAKALKKSSAEQFIVPLQKVPPMIAFKELNSPESAELVFGIQSGVIVDKMSIVVGEGYAVRDVMLQMTSELPNNDVLSMLPWWNDSGRPAEVVWKKVNSVTSLQGSIEPETLFARP